MHGRGYVSLVGAGPGDPGLITVRGRDRLAAADAVVFDRLANPALLAHARPGAALIPAAKAAGHHVMTQDEINALLVDLARRRMKVVRLKGGDPFLFGRGGEEASALAAAGIDFEVIPGITSAFSVPAYAGIPVTDRRASMSVAVVTGHGSAEVLPDWRGLATSVDTLVILMGLRNLPTIAAELIAGGRAPTTPAAAIRAGTYEDQTVITAGLADLPAAVADAGLEAPVTIVVGDVVALAGSVAWFGGLNAARDTA